jgi:diadenosine tetraphosphate (Ap4A) HIT family hydrolase
MRRSCTICAELFGKKENNLCYLVMGSLFNRIIKETENFVVFPSIGQIVEGYLLVIPKQHYLCMGALPDRLFNELENIVDECERALLEVYSSKSILFEHGAVGTTLEKRAGCCTDHAHLHIVPGEVELLDEIKKNYTPQRIYSFKDLKEKWVKNIPYLFYRNTKKEMFVFDVPPVISQYFRQILAKKLNKIDRWDWRRYSGKKEMINTIKRLRGVLK